MPLTTAQMVRERIQDIPTLANDTYYGDGLAVTFQLPHRNLTSASAFVQGTNAWASTGATFNASGYVTFADVISANSAFRVQYVHSVFSDELIDQRVSALGNVLDVSLEFARDLLFDSVKRAKWVAPDSSEWDDTKAIDAVKAIIADIKAEQEEQATLHGGFGEWAITQGEL
jgi:hypothetical protein